MLPETDSRDGKYSAMRSPWIPAIVLALLGLSSGTQPIGAQPPTERIGEVVPRDVRELYQRGVDYLAKAQGNDGTWNNGGESGSGVTGMALMALLASGEDPNFGLYSANIRRATRALIASQDPNTGYMGPSMYHHGFGMLALAEAYGAVDDRNLWPESKDGKQRSIGAALELAVRAAITSQKKNSLGGWRYSPGDNSADTSVSGAVLVGLLAARNAGIEVPDEVIDKAISYYQKMTSDKGQVAYSGGFGGFDESLARISIATLVYSIARRKDLNEYKATIAYLSARLESSGAEHYRDYTAYYQAQALFQGNVEAWEKWNKLLVRRLKQSQLPDGSFTGPHGTSVATSLSLLALAVNFRFLPIYER